MTSGTIVRDRALSAAPNAVASDGRESPDLLSRRTPLYLAVLLLASSALFVIFPALDIGFSALFYSGSRFPALRMPWPNLLRDFGRILVLLVCIALIASLLVKLVRPSRPMLIRGSSIGFLLGSLVLAPGLIVNGLLKNFWGRPRPMQIRLFGGEETFVMAWQPSGACSLPCSSFVSGEASAAIWLTGLAMLVRPAYRPALSIAIGVLVVVLSLNRIAFGGHFLSDVVIAWGITLLVLFGLHRVMVAGPQRARIDAATDRVLQQIALAPGRALRRLL